MAPATCLWLALLGLFALFLSPVTSQDVYAPRIWSNTLAPPSLTQSDVAQSAPVQSASVQFSAAKFSPAKLSTAKFSPAKFSPAKFSPAKLSPAKFSPAKFSPAKFSPAIKQPPSADFGHNFSERDLDHNFFECEPLPRHRRLRYRQGWGVLSQPHPPYGRS
ncbi:hypothetical protein F5883DRAFT_696508 [Diaporthe sp. PMI_573]|nr:hypothetical protein F5883DRAFT_696508 [Diaporthaceae sp. PMI_573]